MGARRRDGTAIGDRLVQPFQPAQVAQPTAARHQLPDQGVGSLAAHSDRPCAFLQRPGHDGRAAQRAARRWHRDGAQTIAVLIPCHRVIRESGEAGLYRWGAERKRAMIGWEQSRRIVRSDRETGYSK